MEKIKRLGENMDKTMIVALDAMGGDLAPMEIVKGAAEAAKELDVLIKLVGQNMITRRSGLRLSMQRKLSGQTRCRQWQSGAKKIPPL